MFLAVLCAQSRGQVPVLVKNINAASTAVGANPTNLVIVGSTAYFVCSDGAHGTELWRSDGTAAGTCLVKDIYPGDGSSAPSDLCDFNGTLLFFAYGPGTGLGLWKSDGTAAGTVTVRDGLAGRSGTTGLVVVSNTVFFTTGYSLYDQKLWKSDGTESGTVLIKDWTGIVPARLDKFVNYNGTLFFCADDGVHGLELWKSDGTSAGTVLVKDILPGVGSGLLFVPSWTSSDLVAVGGWLFFTATDGGSHAGLWKSDGTAAGTVFVKALNDVNCIAASLIKLNDILLFLPQEASYGGEWWRSDGTEAGTYLVRDIFSGPIGGVFMFLAKWQMAVANGTLFFQANDGVSGRELWRTDGTQTGTMLVKNISIGGGDSFPTNMLNVDGMLYFSASDGSHGMEVWKSDGTDAGTTLVKDIALGTNGCNPAGFINLNGKLLFSANDGITGQELWVSDGTESGTRMVRDIQSADGDSNPHAMINLNGTLLFSATDGVHGYELWRSDGTEDRTAMVQDLQPGSAPSYPFYTTVLSNNVLFLTTGSLSHHQLWRSDGSSPGTAMIHEFGSWSVSRLSKMQGTLFFSVAGDWTNELWRSDGTSAGTSQVCTLWTNAGVSPLNFTVVSNTLFFTARGSYLDAWRSRLWKSDGTAAGTMMAPVDMVGTEFWPGEDLVDGGGRLFFTARTYYYPMSIWIWHPIVGPAYVAGVLGQEDWTGYPAPLVNVNGTVFFPGTNGAAGNELWKSDGTIWGTALVKDIWPGPHGSEIGRSVNDATASPVNVGGTLFFSANDGIHGGELWKSDGTTAGTKLVKDICPGVESSYVDNLFDADGMLYFVADNGVNGRELWRSDGTTQGTVMVADLTGDTRSSEPSELTVASNRLFFAARAASVGKELFSLPLLSQPPLAADDAWVTTMDCAVGVPISFLLENDFDPAGGFLSFQSAAPASAYGGSVTRSGDWLTYSPPFGFKGPDTFTYTMCDSRGATTVGTVRMTIVPSPPFNHCQGVSTPRGLLLAFRGVAEGQYELQSVADLKSSSWVTLAAGTAGPTGLVQWQLSGTSSPVYYRVRIRSAF